MRKLTHLRNPAQACLASYSPDGTRLVMIAELGASPDALTAGLYTMAADGGPLVPVITLDQPDLILSDWGPAALRAEGALTCQRHDASAAFRCWRRSPWSPACCSPAPAHGHLPRPQRPDRVRRLRHRPALLNQPRRDRAAPAHPRARGQPSRSQPDWSPDGRQIAFWSDLGGEPRLYVMDRDGSHQRLVFADQPGYGNFSPGYTPDGRRLVFQRCAPEPIDVCAIYSVGVDGRNLRALTRFKTGLGTCQRLLADRGTRRPRIAFGRFGAGGIHVPGVRDGRRWQRVRVRSPRRRSTAIPGEWTPDSRHLLVQSNGFRLNASIYRVRADGTGLRRLTRPSFPNGDIQPNSSPNGERIAFASDRRYPDVCCNDLYVMRSDGSGLHRVATGDLVGVVDPDWGSAPRDDATAAATAATRQLAPARTGTSAAELCARRPELRLPGRCGPPRQGFAK